MFNINELLDQTTSAPLSTEYPLVPIGVWAATIQKPRPNKETGQPDWIVHFEAKDASKGDSYKLNVEVTCDAIPNYKGPLNVRGEIWLDIEDGQLSTAGGANVGLGRLLDATGLNQAGMSLGDQLRGLIGKRVQVTVRHEADRREAGKFWARVGSFAPIA